MAAKLKPVRTEQSAQLFLELWRMEEAGISSSEAVKLLKNQATPFQPQLRCLSQRLQSGHGIAEAGFKCGLFTQTQATLIDAGERGGCLTAIYKELAEYYAEKSSRERKIKAKLYLPAVTLLLAFCIEPIPQLFQGQISGFDYLQITLGRFILLSFLAWLLIRLPFWLTEGFLSSGKAAFHRLQMQLPLVRNWLIKRQVHEFLVIFGLMLTAGLPFTEALPNAVATIKNTQLRKEFDVVFYRLQSGESVADILRNVTVLDANLLQIMDTAEQSGKLDSAILHWTRRQAETIALENQMLAEWLPRLAYMLVALWMAHSILTTRLPMPNVL